MNLKHFRLPLDALIGDKEIEILVYSYGLTRHYPVWNANFLAFGKRRGGIHKEHRGISVCCYPIPQCPFSPLGFHEIAPQIGFPHLVLNVRWVDRRNHCKHANHEWYTQAVYTGLR